MQDIHRMQLFKRSILNIMRFHSMNLVVFAMNIRRFIDAFIFNLQSDFIAEDQQ